MRADARGLLALEAEASLPVVETRDISPASPSRAALLCPRRTSPSQTHWLNKRGGSTKHRSSAAPARAGGTEEEAQGTTHRSTFDPHRFSPSPLPAILKLRKSGARDDRVRLPKGAVRQKPKDQGPAHSSWARLRRPGRGERCCVAAGIAVAGGRAVHRARVRRRLDGAGLGGALGRSER